MKNMLICCMFTLIATAIFTGCSNEQAQPLDPAEWKENMRKSQQVEVKEWDDTMPTFTMTEDEEIQTFVDILDVDTWEPAQVPDKAEKEKQFILYQEPTRRLGEAKANQSELQAIASIVTYRDAPYIELQISDWTTGFTVSESAAESLNGF
ncbi:hypothetical protein KFZ56_18205 [Virgibacillus sp. NKC19-3]|uniref:hypothetical protein n=1 Tax=Virgibacillus saliphilus TaxID=2831674 RepID=UPI001C9B52FC|nr:hypothetical protein [Virgibacillus sp. NKC19-3]MBY7144953.1 hypothetical protein [Virgibacillus sp. NKC19-3]